jgi:hypothetical protein
LIIAEAKSIAKEKLSGRPASSAGRYPRWRAGAHAGASHRLPGKPGCT